MNNKALNYFLWFSFIGSLTSIYLWFNPVNRQSSQDALVKHRPPALSERDELGRLKQKINFNGKAQLGDQFIGASRIKDRIEIWKQTNLIRTGNPSNLNNLAKSDCDKALRIFGIGPVDILHFDPVDISYFDEQAPGSRLFRCDEMAKRERDRHIRLKRSTT